MSGEDEIEEEIKKKLLRMLLSSAKKDMEEPVYDRPVDLTKDNFDEFLSRHKCVVVDFWAEWCYPCKMLEPVIYRLARRFAGKVVFARVNVDENPELASRFYVMSIPTLVFYHYGKEVDRMVGALPEAALASAIKEVCISED